MTTALTAIPGLDWVLNPIGILAVAAALAAVFSGALGRVVLRLETTRLRLAARPVSPSSHRRLHA